MEKINISFFCPAYNEEENLESVVLKVIEILKEISNRFEVIIVNNGSTDKTGDIADNLAKRIPEVRVIHHSTNREYGGALKSGFTNAKYENVAYMDSDNQYDFSDIKIMIPLLEKYDIVTGYRMNRSDSSYRIFQSEIYNLVIKILFGLRVKDIDCSLKIYKKYVLDNMQITSNSPFIDAEMMIKAKKNGYKIGEIGVKNFPRIAGSATGANPKGIFITLKEIICFWLKRR